MKGHKAELTTKLEHLLDPWLGEQMQQIHDDCFLKSR
jgi:hypothetical protein